MARQWIKERKTALDIQSHRCTKREIFPYQLNHFRQARKAFHSETEILVAPPVSPHPEKVQNMLITHPSFQPTSWKLPYSSAWDHARGYSFLSAPWPRLPLFGSSKGVTNLFRQHCTQRWFWGGGSSMYFFPLSLWFLQNYILQQCLISFIIISGRDSLLHLFRFKYKIIVLN